MRKKILTVSSIVIMLVLVVSIFGCSQPTTPASSSSPSTAATGTATAPPSSPTSSAKPTSPATSTASTPPAQAQVIKWKGQNAYVTSQPPIAGMPYESGMGMHGKEWAKWVEKITNGRLVIELAPQGGIVPDTDLFNAVKNKVIDVAAVGYSGNHTGIVPEANFENGPPFLWSTPEDLLDFLYLRGGADLLHQAYLEKNVWQYDLSCASVYSIHSKVPLNSIKDLNGVKIRATGLNAKWFEAFGAKPTNVTAAEGYMALKLGTIDAAHWGLTMLDEAKLKEVEKYNVYKPVGIGGLFPLMINLQSWNALPDDIKKLIDDNTKYIAAFRVQYEWEYAQYTLARAVKDYGIVPISWSDADGKLAVAKGMELTRDMAKVNKRCADIVAIIEQQMKDLGRL